MILGRFFDDFGVLFGKQKCKKTKRDNEGQRGTTRHIEGQRGKARDNEGHFWFLHAKTCKKQTTQKRLNGIWKHRTASDNFKVRFPFHHYSGLNWI